MKNNFIYWCMLAFAVCFFGSCSDDKVTRDDLLGTWNLRSDNALDLTWESLESISINNIPIPVSTAASIAEEYGNTQLREKLKSVTFRANDMLEVLFIDETGLQRAEVYGTYKVINRRRLMFYPDVDKLLEGVEGISAADMAQMKTLASTAGISVSMTFVGHDAKSVRFYLDTNTIKEMKVLIPLLSGSVSSNSAEDIVLKVILDALPGLLDKTDKIELGLSFDKAP